MLFLRKPLPIAELASSHAFMPTRRPIPRQSVCQSHRCAAVNSSRPLHCKQVLLRSSLLLALAISLAGFAQAADDLHKRVDQFIVAGAKGAPLGPAVDDAAFVRRIYLDLAGRVPTSQEATKFIADTDAAKVPKLIDALLQSPEYARRMQDLFGAMLMERRGENPEWVKFLQTSFESNKPWDQIVREILDPDTESEAARGAAFFYTKRLEKVGEQETDYPGLTRDVGRLFLGMDLQCAQCHNHLFIDDYKQEDFQGLFTVYLNTFIRSDVKFPAIGEKVMSKKQDFMSVFERKPLSVGPRVPKGKEIEIPQFEKGQEFLVPPDRAKNFPGIPKFSPLELLAHELPVSSNRAFLDNIVNRLWFVMMGRGLVNPLDQQHAANPPSHPELLAALGEEFVAHKLDIKWFLRELALTDTYRRTTTVPASAEPPAPQTYCIASEKRLSAEQILNSVLAATGPRELAGAPAPTPVADAKPAEPAAADQKPEPSPAEKLRIAFVKAFANAPQEPEVEFAPSLKSALFVLNDPAVLDCLTPQNGNLADRLMKLDDPAALADELYLCVLTRKPTDDERAAVADHLAKNAARRPAAIANLLWAVLASTEFCINH